MTSAAEAELGALFITAKEMVPLLQTLSEIGWPKPPYPVQTATSVLKALSTTPLSHKKLNLVIYYFIGYAVEK